MFTKKEGDKMPKVISDIENAILKAATSIIQDDYRKFSIRNVAKKCHIGIGTVYNYFSSKEELLNKAMIFFINERFLSIEKKMSKVHTVKEKCFEIYEDLQDHLQDVRKKYCDQLFFMMTSSEKEGKIFKGNLDIAIKKLFGIVKNEFKIKDEVLARTIAIVLFIPKEENVSFEDIWNTIERLLISEKEVGKCLR